MDRKAYETTRDLLEWAHRAGREMDGLGRELARLRIVMSEGLEDVLDGAVDGALKATEAARRAAERMYGTLRSAQVDREMAFVSGELEAAAKELCGMEFPTKEALDKYLDEHPDADRSKHRVVETGKGHPAVQRALKDRHVVDVGQLSKEEKAALEKAVKDGVLKKGKGGGYPVLKTVYAVPGYDIDGERKRKVEELKKEASVMDRKAVAKELLKVAKELAADMPMAYLEADDRWKANVSKDLDSVLAGGRGKYEYWSFLTFQEGTSNKFHMFGVLRMPDGTFVGGNAYGRIGYGAKVIEVARGDRSSVMATVQNKERQKMAKGYMKG